MYAFLYGADKHLFNLCYNHCFDSCCRLVINYTGAVMDKDNLFELIENVIAKRTVVDYEQIPKIDLYMDQLTKFIDERLGGYKRNKTDKVLTKTMINNYAKDNLLPPPEKKKYNQEQIALLVLIYHLKSEITISDISAIFDYMETKKISVETVYRAFTEMQKRETGELPDEVRKIVGEEGSQKKTLILLTIIELIVEANSRKLLAERLIDTLKNE